MWQLVDELDFQCTLALHDLAARTPAVARQLADCTTLLAPQLRAAAFEVRCGALWCRRRGARPSVAQWFRARAVDIDASVDVRQEEERARVTLTVNPPHAAATVDARLLLDVHARPDLFVRSTAGEETPLVTGDLADVDAPPPPGAPSVVRL